MWWARSVDWEMDDWTDLHTTARRKVEREGGGARSFDRTPNLRHRSIMGVSHAQCRFVVLCALQSTLSASCSLLPRDTTSPTCINKLSVAYCKIRFQSPRSSPVGNRCRCIEVEVQARLPIMPHWARGSRIHIPTVHTTHSPSRRRRRPAFRPHSRSPSSILSLHPPSSLLTLATLRHWLPIPHYSVLILCTPKTSSINSQRVTTPSRRSLHPQPPVIDNQSLRLLRGAPTSPPAHPNQHYSHL